MTPKVEVKITADTRGVQIGLLRAELGVMRSQLRIALDSGLKLAVDCAYWMAVASFLLGSIIVLVLAGAISWWVALAIMIGSIVVGHVARLHERRLQAKVGE